MSTLELTIFVFSGSIAAGFLGALTGLGGGVVIVPLLTLVFHVDIRYAIGASLVSVIATSSGAAAAYVREGYSNIRVGMFLEIATTVGALTGALLAVHLPPRYIAIIFGIVLLYSAYMSIHPSARGSQPAELPAAWQSGCAWMAPIPTPEGLKPYSCRAACRPDFGLMFVAGVSVRPARHRLRRGQGDSPWTRPCACPSRSPPPPAIS